MNKDEIKPTGIEAEVCADIAKRQRMGKKKYGQELADNHAGLYDRIQHAYEEALDLALYLKWALARVKELDAELEVVMSAVKAAIERELENRTLNP